MLQVSSSAMWDTGYTDPALTACECGPLATRRKRVAVACRCAERVVGLGLDSRVRRLITVSWGYTDRTASLADVLAALRSADAAITEAGKRVSESVWSIFEGRRLGKAATDTRAARTTTDAIRWALGLPGGVVPPIPPQWVGVRTALEGIATAPVCQPEWRTTDVLALAQLVRAGDTELLPILADALQDAGCEDDGILDHCRGVCPHTVHCWVPDLLLDAE